MLQRVSDQLAAALENARLYQDVRSRVNELTALTRIGRRLAATLQLEEVLNTIVEEALNVTPADASGDSDFLDVLREGPAALGVDGGFLVFDTVPLGMAGHRYSLTDKSISGHSLARSKRGRREKNGEGKWNMSLVI